MHAFKSALVSSALVLAAHVPGVAQAAPLVGLTSSNELALIDTNNVAGASRVAITGLAAGDRLVGIDLRPGNNLIYGVSLSNQLYTVDPYSGAASFVAALSSAIVNPGLGYGIDFNPVADFGGGPSLRFVSSAGNNYAINANTGAVGNLTGMIAPGFTAVSYTNSVTLPSSVPPTTQLYYINAANDTLSVALGAFNTPTITPVGSLGNDVLQANGFEVLPGGSAFAALNVDAGTSLVTGIYGIDLNTGAANLLGTFNGTLSGLTSAPVPEPGTLALMSAGLLAMGAVARRRKTS